MRDQIVETLPEINEISDGGLREKVIDVWTDSLTTGGWTAEELKQIPFTLLAGDIEMTFIEHLEALRWHLIRAVGAVVIITIAVFINKNFIFDNIVLAPKNLDFLTYRALCWLSNQIELGNNLCIKVIPFTVTNIDMAGQFLLHIKVSFVLGFVGLALVKEFRGLLKEGRDLLPSLSLKWE